MRSANLIRAAALAAAAAALHAEKDLDSGQTARHSGMRAASNYIQKNLPHSIGLHVYHTNIHTY